MKLLKELLLTEDIRKQISQYTKRVRQYLEAGGKDKFTPEEIIYAVRRVVSPSSSINHSTLEQYVRGELMSYYRRNNMLVEGVDNLSRRKSIYKDKSR